MTPFNSSGLAVTKLRCTPCASRFNEHNQVLWHHSIVWRPYGDKQTSKSHESQVPYVDVPALTCAPDSIGFLTYICARRGKSKK